MASFYGCSNFFGKYLPLLGFQDSTNILDNKELFVVPNKDAFQKVRLFIMYHIIKVGKPRKQFMVSSVLPKNECWDNFQFQFSFFGVCKHSGHYNLLSRLSDL